MIDDQDAWPLLQRLADSVRTEVQWAGVRPLDALTIFPGREPVMDTDCRAVGWIVVTSITPSQTFPAPANTPEATCVSSLAVTVEVGIVRCAPMPRQVGRNDYISATVAEQQEATRLQMADMALLRRAILNARFTDVALGTYTPAGPMGALVGGYWTASIGR